MPYAYDPRAQLSKHKEVWLGLGTMGFDTPYLHLFQSKAAYELLDGLEYSSVRYYLLRSAIARQDRAACRVFVNDWGGCRPREVVNISKFIPGDHYHTMGMQFDTLAAAKRHIRNQLKIPGGLIEKHVYANEGD